MSKLRDEVSRVLWSMGVYHADDAVTSDGIFRADIALDGEKVSLKHWLVRLSADASYGGSNQESAPAAWGCTSALHDGLHLCHRQSQLK